MIAALSGAFAVLAIVQGADILQVNAFNGDTVITWVLTDYPSPGGGEVIDGSYGFWSVLWFNELTQGLSFHRALWAAQPIVLWLITAGLLGWTVARVAGRFAGLLAAAVTLCVSTDVLSVILRPTMHAQTVFAGVAAAAYTVEVAREQPFGSPRRWLVASCLTAVIVGVHLTDAMLWLVGIAPMLIALTTWRLLESSAASRSALRAGAGVCAAAIVIWIVATRIMRAAGVRELTPESTGPIRGLGDLWPHIVELAKLVFALGSGALEMSTAGFGRGLLSALCAAAIVAGVSLPLALAALELRHRSRDPARVVHLVFWSVVVVTLAASVVLTRLADEPSVRYIISMLLAAAATIPLLAIAAPYVVRVGALAASALLIGGAVLSLADREIAQTAQPIRDTIAKIETLAEQTGATTGFGTYAMASPITWNTEGRVVSRPIRDWTDPVCAFPTAMDSDWYRPTGAARTFVLWGQHIPGPPPGLGRPAEEHPLPGGTMYIYDSDIATRLCPP